jgi:transcriptional regulator with XRE-family HTH domain
LTAGTILRQCRKQARLSQEKLASLLHIHQSDVSKLEKNQKSIDLILFRDWTRATNQVEAGIAFLYGLDPAAIMQTVMQISGVA